MPLKPDRDIRETEINFTFAGVCSEGVFMTHGVAGSGAAVPDDVAGTVVQGPLNPSGQKVAGLLMHPFVAYNPLLHRNIYKVTQYSGDKATLLRRGWVTANNLSSGASPDAGRKAYLGPYGTFTNDDALGGPRVGEFLSRVNEDGYCRLYVDLPS